jgi:hypothetical protein
MSFEIIGSLNLIGKLQVFCCVCLEIAKRESDLALKRLINGAN